MKTIKFKQSVLSAVAIFMMAIMSFPVSVKADNSSSSNGKGKAEKIEDLPLSDPTGEIEGFEYVDLGLPSGTLWATCNIGSESPYECGYYFAWGEIEPRNRFSVFSYEYFENEEINEDGEKTYFMTNIGSDISGSEYDAATALWGNTWRMPNYMDIDELLSCCRFLWVSKWEMEGLQIVGLNDKSIFLPLSTETVNGLEPTILYGSYWSSSLSSSAEYMNNTLAMSLHFSNSSPNYSEDLRSKGKNIRPVSSKSAFNDLITSTTNNIEIKGNRVYINGDINDLSLCVVDISGRTIHAAQMQGNTYDIPSLAKGIYSVIIKNNNMPIAIKKVLLK